MNIRSTYNPKDIPFLPEKIVINKVSTKLLHTFENIIVYTVLIISLKSTLNNGFVLNKYTKQYSSNNHTDCSGVLTRMLNLELIQTTTLKIYCLNQWTNQFLENLFKTRKKHKT